MPEKTSKATVSKAANFSSANFTRILYDKKNFTATVTINRPEVLNCFDTLTLNELGLAFLDASRDDAIAVIVVTGFGEKSFCTGADLNEQEHFLQKPNEYYKWMYAFIEMHDRLRNIGKPTIARLNGMVVGGGNELNMACDLAVAADHVVIKQVGAARGSVAAGGATQWLPLIIGDRRAREMLLLCENISAEKALDWGLINQVVPLARLDNAIEQLAEKLYNKLPECTRYTKQQLNFWRDFSWSMTVGHARDWLSVHASSNEVAEGLRSFSNKSQMDYKAIRQGASLPLPLFQAGAEISACHKCKEPMSASFVYCGKCGSKLDMETKSK
jgi:enoyl-CoA hydratase/carnithine racemase